MGQVNGALLKVLSGTGVVVSGLGVPQHCRCSAAQRLKDARQSPSWSAPHVRAARSALWETECSAGGAPRLPHLQNYNSHKALGLHSRRLSGCVALCACARPSTPRPLGPARKRPRKRRHLLGNQDRN